MSQRLFHAKIQFQSWLLLAVVFCVAVYSLWNKQALLIAFSFLLLVIIIERMIHTAYTLTDTDLRIHTSRFSGDRVIPLAQLERIEKVSRLRIFGHALHSYLLITHSQGRQVVVMPQNEQDFVVAVERKKRALENTKNADGTTIFEENSPNSSNSFPTPGVLLLSLLLCCFSTATAQDVVPTAAQTQSTGNVSTSPIIDLVQEQEPDSLVQLPWDKRLVARVQALADEAAASSYTAGIAVYDLTADSLLFAFNQHKVLRPASTQKLFTAISALDLLGRNHRVSTRVYITGQVEKVPLKSTIFDTDAPASARNVLHGNVVIVGGYDPMLSYDDLKAMASAVCEEGIDSIDGRVVADVSMTDTLSLGYGWCWDDVPSSIVPYLSPLFFNHAQPVDGRSTKMMPHPENYFARMFLQELRNRGVGISPWAFRSSSSDALAGSGQPRVVYAATHSVEQILERMMKKSDNLYAESLFYVLAASVKIRDASLKEGAQQVETVLDKAGVNLIGIVVADGSGLSLYDYLTAQSHIAMLRYAYLRPAIFEPLYASLPIAGEDGTLQRRMTKGPARGHVRAKTGTVTGVSSLAGYATASNGHQLAFSIILNGVLKNSVGHDLQDRICQELTR